VGVSLSVARAASGASGDSVNDAAVLVWRDSLLDLNLRDLGSQVRHEIAKPYSRREVTRTTDGDQNSKAVVCTGQRDRVDMGCRQREDENEGEDRRRQMTRGRTLAVCTVVCGCSNLFGTRRVVNLAPWLLAVVGLPKISSEHGCRWMRSMHTDVLDAAASDAGGQAPFFRGLYCTMCRTVRVLAGTAGHLMWSGRLGPVISNFVMQPSTFPGYGPGLYLTCYPSLSVGITIIINHANLLLLCYYVLSMYLPEY
jgi:hypothetical protein